MNSKSKLSIIGAIAVLGIVLLLLMGQWNNPPLPVSDDSIVQTVPEVTSDTEDTGEAEDSAGSTPTMEATSIPPAIEETTTSQPVIEQPAAETTSAISSANDESTTITIAESLVEQNAPTSTTYVTVPAGGGHGSSRSSNSNSQDESNQNTSDGGVNTGSDEHEDSGVNQGTSGNDGTQNNPDEQGDSGNGQGSSNNDNAESNQTQNNTSTDGGVNTDPSGGQDDSPPQDESFFVLPESPVGAAALVVSSLAVLGGFMFLRNRSRAGMPL